MYNCFNIKKLQRLNYLLTVVLRSFKVKIRRTWLHSKQYPRPKFIWKIVSDESSIIRYLRIGKTTPPCFSLTFLNQKIPDLRAMRMRVLRGLWCFVQFRPLWRVTCISWKVPCVSEVISYFCVFKYASHKEGERETHTHSYTFVITLLLYRNRLYALWKRCHSINGGKKYPIIYVSCHH